MGTRWGGGGGGGGQTYGSELPGGGNRGFNGQKKEGKKMVY